MKLSYLQFLKHIKLVGEEAQEDFEDSGRGCTRENRVNSLKGVVFVGGDK